MRKVEVRPHPDVRSYLDELEDSDTERCEDSLKRLADELIETDKNAT